MSHQRRICTVGVFLRSRSARPNTMVCPAISPLPPNAFENLIEGHLWRSAFHRRKRSYLTLSQPPKPPVPPDPPPTSGSKEILPGSQPPRLHRFIPGPFSLRSAPKSTVNALLKHYSHLDLHYSNLLAELLHTRIPISTVIIRHQSSQPPASTPCHGNRRVLSLVPGMFWIHQIQSLMFKSTNCKILVAPPELSTVDDMIPPPDSAQKKHRSSSFTSTEHMGLGQLWLSGLMNSSEPTKGTRQPSSSDDKFKSSSSSEMYYGSFALKAVSPPSQVQAPHISFALLGEAIALKTAIVAAHSLEFHHLTVRSDSQSLVSLINSKSDINELKSVLFDIHSLLETFSFISIFYVSHSVNGRIDSLAKEALSLA